MSELLTHPTLNESQVKDSHDLIFFHLVSKPDWIIQTESSRYLPLFFCLNRKSKKIVTKVPYQDIGFPVPGATSPVGALYVFEDVETAFGKKITVWLLADKRKLYEEFSSDKGSFIARVCIRTGAKHLVLLNTPIDMPITPEAWAAVCDEENVSPKDISLVTSNYFKRMTAAADLSKEKLAHLVWDLVDTAEVA